MTRSLSPRLPGTGAGGVRRGVGGRGAAPASAAAIGPASAVDPAGGAAAPRCETEYRPRRPVDLRQVVGFLRRGGGDPTMAHVAGVLWRASLTPEGVATLALRQTSTGDIRAAAWGPGARWAIAHVPALCGADDDDAGFDASRHPFIADAHRRNPNLRLGRTDTVFDNLAGAVIEQKVTGKQAFAAWRRIVSWYGERAPGPTPRPLYAPPTIEGWRVIPSWAWHRAGLEPPQARTIVEAARRGEAICRAAAAAADADGRDRALTAARGVGLWTAAEVRIRAFGDADAVSVGDYHLAHEVGYALMGERVDDDGMLQLLAPWAGQRQRVIRLIGLSGVHEPRRGPRMTIQDNRSR